MFEERILSSVSVFVPFSWKWFSFCCFAQKVYGSVLSSSLAKLLFFTTAVQAACPLAPISTLSPQSRGRRYIRHNHHHHHQHRYFFSSQPFCHHRFHVIHCWRVKLSIEVHWQMLTTHTTNTQANCPLCFPSLMGSLLLTNRQTIILVTYHLNTATAATTTSVTAFSRVKSPQINKKAIRRQIGQLRMVSRWKRRCTEPETGFSVSNSRTACIKNKTKGIIRNRTFFTERWKQEKATESMTGGIVVISLILTDFPLFCTLSSCSLFPSRVKTLNV